MWGRTKHYTAPKALPLIIYLLDIAITQFLLLFIFCWLPRRAMNFVVISDRAF